MKQHLSVVLIALTLFSCLYTIPAARSAEQPPETPTSLASAWQDVMDAKSKGRPKTAIERLEPLIIQAKAEKDYPLAVRAIGFRILFETEIEGYKAEECIKRLETELEKAPPEMKPILEALVAHWYWGYYEQNRWRFLQRTATAESPGDDIQAWSLHRIFDEIDSHFSAALSAQRALQAIPTESWSLLLERHGHTSKTEASPAPDPNYRPTVYDFIAQEALTFYRNANEATPRSQDAYDLPAASPVFDDPASFMSWKIETDDSDSNIVKGLQLMQDLMRFHADDTDRSAFMDIDLHRLNYGKNTAVGEEKNTRYKAALDRFIAKSADHQISARGRAALASMIYQEGDRVAALGLAREGNTAFPDTPGGNECYNLIQQVLAKSSNITTERAWNAPWPTIDVTYRNLTDVHFRIVPYDWEALITRKGWQWEDLDHDQQQKLLRLPTLKSWQSALPETTDYHDRVESLPVPEDIPGGFYMLISSHDADFSSDNNHVRYTPFWVSDLALVLRVSRGNSRIEGFVLDANSGNPVDGAAIRTWYRGRNGDKEKGPNGVTDANGLFSLAVQDSRSYMVLATHDQQQLSSVGETSTYSWRKPRPQTQTIFFSDRSIYRPGQTIHYKGLCIRTDTENDSYATIANQDVTVSFRDVNGKEIATQTRRANDYGSFAGSFTAPTDRAMGRMNLRINGGPRGQVGFRVEEYKRPKFKVTLDPPAVAAALNGDVTLAGKAMAYTGAAIDGASVNYRIVRDVRYPDWWRWCFWFYPMPSGGSQEIAHGQLTTETDGSFNVTFVAKPDLSVDRSSEPTFSYTIHTDVTDSAGETRSAQRTVRVGYTALKAAMTANEWQQADKPVSISIATQTLDGEGQPAQVTIKVHRLKEPERVQRAALSGYRPSYYHRAGAEPPKPDATNPNSWELAEMLDEQTIKTSEAGAATIETAIPAGLYRAVLTTQDRFGAKVTALLPLRVVDPTATRCDLPITHVVAGPSWTAQPGDDFSAIWGSGYDTARAFIEIEHRGEMLQAYWTNPDNTQHAIEQAVTEAMRGGFTLHVTQVRENRAYLTSRRISVPWQNKQLSVRWEHMVSKLEPGQKETWTAHIEGPDAEPAVAEMVASLYDKSLDAFTPHNWMTHLNVFRQDSTRLRATFQNTMRGLNHIHGQWPHSAKSAEVVYWRFPHDLLPRNVFHRYRRGLYFKGAARMANAPMPMTAAVMDSAAPAPEMALEEARDGSVSLGSVAAKANSAPGGPPQEPPPQPDLDQVSARENLNETAFFFPHLVSDKDGKVSMTFTMPEALTEWQFMAFAHDKDLRSGSLRATAVTSKDIMVQPNPPRFMRESDTLEFTVKVTNLSTNDQSGSVRLTFADARTLKSVDDELGLSATDKPFDVPAKQSRSYAWRITVPDGMGFLQYKAVGSTGKLSDGEMGYLPVLPRRIMVTESIPLPIRKAGKKTFRFEKLLRSERSESLEHQNLVVQMVSNPSWYAVMALPYLMEYQHECSEQVFNRLYANSLGAHIATSDPKIKHIFEQWRGTDALKSPMEKNQDLKSVMLEETPWLAQGENESEARRRVGILFDENRLESEMARAMRKLSEQQLNDGAWPWFPGGQPSSYITLYITTGFGRMRHLGVENVNMEPAIKSLEHLDTWIDKTYHDILRHGNKDANHMSSTIALYLYGRSFFLEDRAIAAGHQDAIDYFLGQAAKYWLGLPRQSQAHLAIAVQRFGKDATTPKAIVTSLKEFSKTDEELGMYWRDTEYSWWWYRAPIETQAMMIEVFDEVAKDSEAVEECKVWLLKQKQTQDWKTTKATADAIYALLLRGTDLLASDALVEVTLGDKTIEPKNVEAGTGFYEERFGRGEIKPVMGKITLTKVDDGVAWGSMHWQYFEDMSKITPHTDTPLTLEKSLYIKVNTKKGPVLQPVTDTLAVGAELVTRIVLRVDRDMEYVHMKDHRGSGTEPVNVLSSYKYQDGLRYYESTKDTASHFFIDYLPKGTYVFEYSTRIQHRGSYQTGIANIQCMYAPEFNSHSQSFVLRVTE